jgi:hypothetical protein
MFKSSLSGSAKAHDNPNFIEDCIKGAVGVGRRVCFGWLLDLNAADDYAVSKRGSSPSVAGGWWTIFLLTEAVERLALLKSGKRRDKDSSALAGLLRLARELGAKLSGD